MQEPPIYDDSLAPLTPTRLEPAASPAPRHASAHRFYQTAAFGLLGLLGLGVLGVFMWLPQWVTAPPPPIAESAAVASAKASTPTAVAAPELSQSLPEPPDARPAAQKALAALWPRVDALRAQRLDVWGPDDLKAIESSLADGEQAYREQRYTAARQAYAQAAQGVQMASAKIPTVVTDYLDEGERALLSQDAGAADTAFRMALSLAPDNTAAQRGVRRAATFDRVLALLTEAKGYERMNEPARASSAYHEALKLDPEATTARQALARIETAKDEAAYAVLMSRGFTALQAANYPQATASFAQARRLRPKSSAVANALAQTKARATAAHIERALTAAQRAEQHEQWSEAGAQFRVALAIDKGLELAARGADRARQRAALDRRLRSGVAHPERLADDAVYREAEGVLKEARAVSQPGQRLTSQITSLSALLIAARTSVAVTLHSDDATDVALLKVGQLGRFTERALTLFPGRYTAVGTRRGYRDTRVQFTVAAGGAPIITVQCLEALSFGR